MSDEPDTVGGAFRSTRESALDFDTPSMRALRPKGGESESPLSALLDKDRRGERVSNCARCGAPAHFRVQVQVARVNRQAKNLQGEMHSQSVRVCDSCAVAAFRSAIHAAGSTAPKRRSVLPPAARTRFA